MAEHPERRERPERGEQGERAERAERSERPERSGRSWSRREFLAGAGVGTGSRPSSGNHAPAIEKLKASLVETFPPLAGVRFSHAWGGTMAFTRDFTPRVGTLGDEPSRPRQPSQPSQASQASQASRGSQGNVFYGLGYCGEGVVMSQVAGHVLAKLVAGEGDGLAELPFVGGPPPWMGFEPLRSLGVKGMEHALRALAGEL